MYITTRTDTHHTVSSTPNVLVHSVHDTREKAAVAIRAGGLNMLEIWPLKGRRDPRPGDCCGTYRDGHTLYAVGSELGARQLTRDAYLTTRVHAWTGQGVSRVEIWLESDGTIRVDDTSQGRNWSAPEWTSCHDISEADQQRIREAAEQVAIRRGQNGGELGFVALAPRRAS